MTGFLDWLTQSGERLTVAAILLIDIFVIVYGVQKRQRWWVPGWMLTDCEAEKEKLDKQVQEYVKDTKDKLDRLEQLEQERRDSRRR